MIRVHHLGVSQSERVVWLLEELGLPYELKRYERDPATKAAPPELRAVHPLGAAPIIEDGNTVLAESAAIAQYLLARYGNGRLEVARDAPNFADYLYWLHYVNGSFMPVRMLVRTLAATERHPLLTTLEGRLERHMRMIEEHLGKVDYLAGPEFTAADIIMHYPFGAGRAFYEHDVSGYPNIRAWLERITQRPAYQKTVQIV